MFDRNGLTKTRSGTYSRDPPSKTEVWSNDETETDNWPRISHSSKCQAAHESSISER